VAGSSGFLPLAVIPHLARDYYKRKDEYAVPYVIQVHIDKDSPGEVELSFNGGKYEISLVCPYQGTTFADDKTLREVVGSARDMYKGMLVEIVNVSNWPVRR